MLSFEFSGTPVTPDAGDDAGDDGGADAGADAGTPPKKADTSDDGCSCRTAGEASTALPFGLAALAFGAGLTLRRRARAKRR